MYVYIMKCANYYKIGHSKNPKSRRASIQTHNPLDVKICALLKTNEFIKTEKKLHNQFLKRRTRGEWFELEEKDLIKLKIEFGFEFLINIGEIQKIEFDNTISKSETQKFRINNLDLENAILHFEDLFDCSINNNSVFKKACLKYDIDIVMTSINNLFNRDFTSQQAYSKLNTFCKYENEKRKNPVSYLTGIIKSIYTRHYNSELDDELIDLLEEKLKNVNDVDGFLKTINSKKFYLDYQEFWDNIPSFVLNSKTLSI